jgi:hypothetical protein
VNGRRHALGWVAALAILTALTPARAAVQAESPQIEIEVEIDAVRATVGDAVPARLAVTLPAGTPPPRWPAWEATWGEAEIRAIEPTRRTELLTLGPDAAATAAAQGQSRPNDSTRYEQTLLLVAYRTGQVALPPVTVEVEIGGQEVALATPDDLAYEVTSVLPADGAATAPWPSDPPRPLPTPRVFAPTVATLAAAIAILSVLLWRRRQRPAPGPLTARAELLAALARLEGARPSEVDGATDARALPTALSAALRRYLDRRLQLAASRSSALEIERALARTALGAGLAAEPAAEIVALLRRCDAARFGHAQDRPAGPEVGAVRALLFQVEQALDRLGFTDPPLAPAATEGAGGRRRAA